jgi:replicative DNA helicase
VLKSGRTNIRHRVREAEAPREVESRLVSVMLRFEEGRDKARADLDPGDLVGTRVSGIVRTILRLVDEGKGVDYPTLFSALDDDDDKEILTHIAFRDEPEVEAEEMEDCIRALQRQCLMRERRELQKRIQTAADAAAIDTLLDRTQQLARQIDALS